MISGALFAVFIILLCLSVPIGVAMGVACLIPNLLDPSISTSLQFVARSSFASINSTIILAIPLFMLSGSVMAHGGLAKRLFDVIALAVGKIPGGMPCAVILTCLFYGAISGSAAATSAAVGAMSIPILLELGYDKKYCGALVAASGGLGMLIPPSLPFISYAMVTSVPVADLFIAGVLPGCLVAALMIVFTIYRYGKSEDKVKIAKMNDDLKARGAWKVCKDGFWAFLMPVIILGGIYSGVMTPTEAACISVVYSIVICVFVYRTADFKTLIVIFREGIKSFAPIGIMSMFALVLMKVMTMLNLPTIIGNFVATSFSGKVLFLLVLNIILLLLGMVIDVGPAVMVIAPIILTAAVEMGIDPIHLGVIMTVNLAIGTVSPPFGMTLFVTAPMVKLDPVTIGRKAFPLIICQIIALFLVTYVEWFSLALI